jgi:hypothetical protein
VLNDWTSLALFVLPIAMLVSLMVGGVLLSLRRQRTCPSCHTAMRTVAQPTESVGTTTYEVIVCDGCSNSATMVHGHQSRFAYCPSCLNRALHTPSIRQPDGSVKVCERCDLCSYSKERVVGVVIDTTSGPQMGRVINFPPHRTQRGKRVDKG